MTKRITYLDSLKAILILLVILGHAVQFNTEEYETNPLFQFIYSFHMPLFLFISGYLTCRGSFKRWNIGKRALQLLLPFITWALISPFLESRACTIKPFLYPDTGLWFLYNLFFYSVIANVSEWIESKKRIKLEYSFLLFYGLLGIFMLMFHTLFNCTQLLYHIPFFYAGYLWKRYDVALKSTYLIGFMGGYFLLLAMEMIPSCREFISHGIVKYLFTYGLEFLGMIMFFELGRRYLNKEIPLLKSLGTMALGIYACHFVILHNLNSILAELAYQQRVAVSFLLAAIISSFFVKIVSHISYIRTFLIGQR